MIRLEILICDLTTFNQSGEAFPDKFLLGTFLQ